MRVSMLRKLTESLGVTQQGRESADSKEAERKPFSGGVQAFAGACLLTAAILLPHVHAAPVVGGFVLAGLIRLAWSVRRR